MEAIKQAALALDNHKNSHWTEDGRPSLKAIRQLAGNTEITQEQLDAALPDLRRKEVNERGKEKAEVEVTVKREPGARDPGKPVQDVRVVATERGFYGGKIREPGESFMFTGIPGMWMRPETKEEARRRKERDEAHAAGEVPANAWANEVVHNPI